MSKATKRKHVAREVLEEFVSLKDNQLIVKVLAGRGNNLHEVGTPDGKSFLASMPVKFRKNVWIKRGDYVIAEPIEEGDKVKAEITQVLYKHHIRDLKSQNLWPARFEAESVDNTSKHSAQVKTANQHHGETLSDDESEEDEDIFVNTNRAVNYETDSGTESDKSQ